MARKKLPATFVHFRCTNQLTEALDNVAAEQSISRSEAARVILELYLFDDVRLVAAREGIKQVRTAVYIAQSAGFEAFKTAFAEALDGVADERGRPRPAAYALRGAAENTRASRLRTPSVVLDREEDEESEHEHDRG